MYEMIGRGDALREVLVQPAPRPVVALDTEFIRERTYRPRLALVQIERAGRILLVDPLDLGDPEPLRELLADRNIEKRMHSASEDLEALLCHFGVLPEPLFDTQIAAALTGLGAGLSYQKLIQSLLGITLEKGETRSDWLARPLSESQCRYAADDVCHLGEAADRLDQRLRELGRRAWLEEDCARLLASAQAPDDPHPHLAMRGAQRLDAQAQARLCRLLRWREQRASELDRPRRWLLENDLALDLSGRPPGSRGEFEQRLDAHPKGPRKLRGELWELISRPLDEVEQEVPLAQEPSPALRARVKRLQDAVARVAKGLDLPDTLLANRRSLEALAQEPDRWPAMLAGWRRELLFEPLQAAID